MEVTETAVVFRRHKISDRQPPVSGCLVGAPTVD